MEDYYKTSIRSEVSRREVSSISQTGGGQRRVRRSFIADSFLVGILSLDSALTLSLFPFSAALILS